MRRDRSLFSARRRARLHRERIVWTPLVLHADYELAPDYFGTPFDAPAYRLEEDRVIFRGALRRAAGFPGTGAELLDSALPEDCRPDARTAFGVPMEGFPQALTVSVETDGTLTLFAPPGDLGRIFLCGGYCRGVGE